MSGFLAPLRRAWRKLTGAAFLEELAHVYEEVRRLTMDEARHLAFSILEDEERYRVTRPESTEAQREMLSKLAPGLREFFGHFERVQCVYADDDYNRSDIGEAAHRKGFLRVATSIEHTELVVRPGEEKVYEVDGSEETLDESASVPSIFHWVILTERLTDAEAPDLK